MTDDTATHSPAFYYGMYIGEVGDLAGILVSKGVTSADHTWDKLFDKATKTTAIAPVVATTAIGWLRKLRLAGRAGAAAAAHNRMDDAVVAMGEWDGFLELRHLNSAEQADVVLGYSYARRANRLRRESRRGGQIREGVSPA